MVTNWVTGPLFTPNVYVDVATFYNQYDDLLSVELQTPFVEPSPSVHLILPLYLRNGVLGNTRGIEISPVWNMTKWWRLKGSYSYVHLSMRDKSNSIDVSTVHQLQGDSPQHKAVIQSYFELPKNFQLDLTYRYVSSLPDLQVAAYSTADARLGWRINRQFELSLVGQNLLPTRTRGIWWRSRPAGWNPARRLREANLDEVGRAGCLALW